MEDRSAESPFEVAATALLPDEIARLRGLDPEEREQLRAAMSYPEDSVGALMDFEMVTVREDVSLEVVLRYLRRFDELPTHTDQVFVVDREERLKGVLPLNKLIVTDLDGQVVGCDGCLAFWEAGWYAVGEHERFRGVV